MKVFFSAFALLLTAAPALAQEADGLKLPAGFHASVVADGVGPARHLAVRDNGDIYISTPRNQQGFGGGIVAMHLNPDHTAAQSVPFGAVDGGTGIRFYHGMLYASSPGRVYRYTFHGKSLLPDPEPQVVIDGMPADHGPNRTIAFDDKGNLYVSLGGSGNICTDPKAAKGSVPVGLKPCPDMGMRAGVWRFSAVKLNQQFKDGVLVATGIRDISSLDWSKADGALYGIAHGRDATHQQFPNLVSATDDDNIADEMHKIGKNTDFGWPYTYWDGVKNVRLTAPEYGGDGKTPATGNYDAPVATFQSGRAAPIDLTFYTGKQFPAQYRGGAFVVLHGSGGPQLAGGHNGYNVEFIPFDKNGKSGAPSVFADGFAGPDPSSKNAGGKAKYRPIGAAVAPDGSLYVVDSNKGRLWRITYGN